MLIIAALVLLFVWGVGLVAAPVFEPLARLGDLVHLLLLTGLMLLLLGVLRARDAALRRAREDRSPKP